MKKEMTKKELVGEIVKGRNNVDEAGEKRLMRLNIKQLEGVLEEDIADRAKKKAERDEIKGNSKEGAKKAKDEKKKAKDEEKKAKVELKAKEGAEKDENKAKKSADKGKEKKAKVEVEVGSEKEELAKKKYSKVELEGLKWQLLKKLGSALGVTTFRIGRDQIVEDVLKVQKKK